MPEILGGFGDYGQGYSHLAGGHRERNQQSNSEKLNGEDSSA